MRPATHLLLSLAVLLPAPVGAGERAAAARDWWSLRPLDRPALPELPRAAREQARGPIDLFVLARLGGHGLRLSPEADRRTLIRRLSFDLLGLPPAPDDVERFAGDPRPDAWERLVDRSLASPAFGERWARHWLDVVHYADTHGYDKDKPRPNAWPYRDWVVRAFNDDRPYRRFVLAQIAGDVLFPDSADGVVATGLLAAGPWDFIGHAELPETKLDGRIARHLDRDDMVRTVMTAFTSTTVGCARCHDHKFDPVTMEDYYSLQAVFAALDRADREYEPDPEVGRRRRELAARRDDLEARRKRIDDELARRGGEALAAVDRELAAARRDDPTRRVEAFGYHSAIEARADVPKWVQVDLGAPVAIDRIVYVGCHDDFNGIGAGFGFPARYRIEVADDPEFAAGVTLVEDRTGADVANPGVEPRSVEAGGARARYVRVTATRLAHRKDDWIFALAELSVITPEGRNAARGATVSALDSIEAPPRWRRENLVDGYYHGIEEDGEHARRIAELETRRRAVIDGVTDAATRRELDGLAAALERTRVELAALPPPAVVYCGAVHTGNGAFRGTGHDGGRPREVRVLERGDLRSPGAIVGPGTADLAPGVPARFALPEGHAEGERRRALGEWIVDARNPLTWRSIANRVWQYHVGRAIAETPNDFGRMGAAPAHPELLDWLAVGLRDGAGQSLKRLHRAILSSAVYRQDSAHDESAARVDSSNALLWRMNRRRLEAEEVRDAVLEAAGRLDRRMGGPGFRCFVLERPEHSPHYEYHKHDPDDPASHRRSIYRFIVRSQPDPFMSVLDCADSNELVARRDETLTPLQALALLNDRFMLRMAERFAVRLEREAAGLEERIERAFRLGLGRAPAPAETRDLAAYAREAGLAAACRVIFNLNEFVFVD